MHSEEKGILSPVERRPETPEPTVLGAGIDPTYIPGLTGVATTATGRRTSPDGPAGADDTSADGTEADEEAGAQTATDTAFDATETDGDRDDHDGTDAGTDEEPPEGPSFEVSDHRGSIVADGRGVVFRLDDTEAHFRWSDIGSVEIGASRFGKRFEVAVGTREPRRRFDAEVIAPTRKTLQQWTDDLDAVLDVWFDDGAE